MISYFIQCRLGDEFEDLHIRARSSAAALRRARRITRLRSQWNRFII
jgi:hypothetical protein